MSVNALSLLQERRLAYELYRQSHPPVVNSDAANDGATSASHQCPDCLQNTFGAATQVCSATGMLHLRENKRLVGGLLFDQDRQLNSAELLSAIEGSRVKWQPSRTQRVLVDQSSMKFLHSFGVMTGWNAQRFGLLYGKYEKSSGTIEVHTIYEPLQHGNGFSFQRIPLESEEGRAAVVEMQKIDRLAHALGLRRVGFFCTRRAWELEGGEDQQQQQQQGGTVLTARELLSIAQEQSIHGDECVLLTLSSQNTSEAGGSVCEAWQASAQCVRLFQNGVLREPREEEKAERLRANCQESAIQVYSSIELEVVEEKREGASGDLKFQSRESCHFVSTPWFTSYIAVESFDSPVIRNNFMRRHRPGFADPLPVNLKQYWLDPKRSGDSFLERVKDFHVLAYLVDALGEEKMLGQKAVSAYSGPRTLRADAAQDDHQRNTLPREGWAKLLSSFDPPEHRMREFERAVNQLMALG